MHDCGRFHWPATNQEYWEPKILRNVERDQQTFKQLEALGWKVIVVWECELKNKVFSDTVDRLVKQLVSC